MENADELWPDFPTVGKDSRDSREMCFLQGKACVYMSDDRSRIITEWPNSVVDELLLADKSRTRNWPDGSVERFEPGDPAGKTYPYNNARSRTLTR